jgi:hypothetical protein
MRNIRNDALEIATNEFHPSRPPQKGCRVLEISPGLPAPWRRDRCLPCRWRAMSLKALHYVLFGMSAVVYLVLGIIIFLINSSGA